MTDWGEASSVTDHQYKANSSNALISPFSNHNNCNRHARIIAQEEGIQGSAVGASVTELDCHVWPYTMRLF